MCAFVCGADPDFLGSFETLRMMIIVVKAIQILRPKSRVMELSRWLSLYNYCLRVERPNIASLNHLIFVSVDHCSLIYKQIKIGRRVDSLSKPTFSKTQNCRFI